MLAQANIRKAYIFAFLASCHFLSGILVPFFTDWGKISFAEIMVLQIWFAAVIFIMEVPTGAVADYFGRKASVVLGVAIGVVGNLVYISKPNFWIFALAEFLLAVGCSFVSGAEDALLYDSLKSIRREGESKNIFGKKRCLGLVGMLIAAPLGSIVAGYFGLRAPMFIDAILGCLALFVALSFYEPQIGTNRGRDYGLLMFGGLKHLVRHRVLRLLSINGVLVFSLSFILVWLYQPVLKSFDVGLGFFGFFHLTLSISQIIVTDNFARLERLARSKKNFWLSCVLLSGGAFIVLALIKNIILAACCFAIISGFGIARWTLDQNYMQKYIESHNRATVLSAISMMRNIAKVICYAMAGILMYASLKVTLMFFGIALLALSVFSKIKESDLMG